jgi:hypothetical protein
MERQYHIAAFAEMPGPVSKHETVEACGWLSFPSEKADFQFRSRIEDRGQVLAGAEFGFGADEIVALKQGKIV